MITRTIYVPANQIGRHILNYIVVTIPCSMDRPRRVADTISIVITMPPGQCSKLERILKMFDLA